MSRAKMKKKLFSYVDVQDLRVGDSIDIRFLQPEEFYRETPWERVTTIRRKTTGELIITTTERAFEVSYNHIFKIKY